MRAQEIAHLVKGRLLGENVEIKQLSPLYCAVSGDLSMVSWPKDLRLAKHCAASSLMTTLDFAADYADQISASIIVVQDYYQAFMALAQVQGQGLLLPLARVSKPHIDADIALSAGVYVGRSELYSGVKIGPGAVIGDDVVIKEGVNIGAGAVIYGPCIIGRGSIIGSNSVIGSPAFVPYEQESLPSLGGVRIGAGVQIGALCTIDKGLLGLTSIMDQSRIDNLVHVGHDVYIGQDVVIAAQSGLAGFAKVHDRVTLGGQVGVAPQVIIGEGARVSGKSFVHGDIKAYEIWSGNPSLPHSQYLRAYARDKRYKKGKK